VKKAVSGLFFILSLLFVTVAGALLIPMAEANPVIPRGSVAYDPSPPSIEVQSPLEGQRLAPADGVWLKFKVTVPKTSWGSIGTTFGDVTSVRFILDSEQEQDLNLNQADQHGVMSYSLNLGKLSGGEHTLRIIAEGIGYYGTATHDLYPGSNPSFKEVMHTKSLNSTMHVSFNVEGSSNVTSVSPSVHVLSPENRAYETAQVSLNFTVDGVASQVWYTLDSGGSIPLLENITLIDLSVGFHLLTVYAIDTAGNWVTPQAVNFEIALNSGPAPQRLSMEWTIVVSGALITGFAVCVLYHHKTRSKQKTSKLPAV
jgi:hypothetical protein